MDKLPRDFVDLLKLLNEHKVRYLLVGGHAVSYHGFARLTRDMDIWVEISEKNAPKIVAALQDFGFSDSATLNADLFLQENRITRMGIQPMRIEIMTTISGADFAPCYRNRIEQDIDGLIVPTISLADLRRNKQASGRSKDLADLDNLPEAAS